jgi:hypothetical protein
MYGKAAFARKSGLMQQISMNAEPLALAARVPAL